ncbi:MAG: serine hydrolase [Magnetococcales bacterium]|nr:serine hydrolase [Magnetococcales bacterium]
MKPMLYTLLVSFVLTASAANLFAYPLDGWQEMGISRLQGFDPKQGARGAPRLPEGARQESQTIRLNLTQTDPTLDLDESHRDPALQKALEGVFLSRDPSYGVVVADMSDPSRLVWAGVRADRPQMPGSVGKVLTMLGLFHELARAFPDIEARRTLLRSRRVTAGEWVKWDEHKVPLYDPQTNTVRSATIQPGDHFTLAEWVDHMISASANGAAATVWKETVLLRHFGDRYPPSKEEEAHFFRTTPKPALWHLARSAVVEPMEAVGLRWKHFKVGSFWTKTAKTLIPGEGGSVATPREMARFLLRLEQGRLVDLWSSLEMKKFLYTTSRRYRYIFAPELAASSAFFKSGSFYRCQAEAGFTCGKYQGNRDNLMNSLAIIESPAPTGPEQKRYFVALISNVMKKNSAWDHSRLGAAIDRLVQTRMAVTVNEQGKKEEIKASGGE